MFFRLRTVLLNALAEGATGSSAAPTEQAATPPAETTTKTVPKSPHATKLEKRQKSAGELSKWLTEQKAPGESAPASTPATQPPTETATAVSEAIADEGGKAPKQREGESDKKYEARLLDALQKLRDAEGNTSRERSGREAAEKKANDLTKAVADFEKKLARGKNPEEALEFLLDTTGLTLEDVIKGVNAKKIRVPGAKPKLDPEVQARMDKIEAENKRLSEIEDKRQQEAMTAHQRAAFEGHVKQAVTYLEEQSENLPLLAASSWAAKDIINNAYAQKVGDISGIAKQLEENVATNVLAALKGKNSLKSLAKRDPELKAFIIKELGLEAAKPAETPPATKNTTKGAVSKTSTEASPPVSTKNMRGKERSAQAASNLAQWLKEQREKK